MYHATVVADCAGLVRLLRRFEASEVHTVYEAGTTGYWLHDALTEAGFDSIVTPPSVDTDPWHGNLSRQVNPSSFPALRLGI